MQTKYLKLLSTVFCCVLMSIFEYDAFAEGASYSKSDLNTPTLGSSASYTLTEISDISSYTGFYITKYLLSTDSDGNTTYTPVYYSVNIADKSYGSGTTISYYWGDDGISTDSSGDFAFKVSYSSSSKGTKSGDNYSGDFISNSSTGNGGALDNEDITLGTIDGDFVKNSASDGGAIYNDGATITKIVGDFIGNSADNYGGAIYNYDSSSIGSITGDFIGNTSDRYGGAIYNNESSTIDTIVGDFIGNSADNYGGAIANDRSSSIGSITGDFIGNTSDRYGGAIYNNDYSSIDSIEGDFANNTSSENGGAIYNSSHSVIGSIEGDFTNNTSGSYGGAIYNYIHTTIDTITGDFESNTADIGGAISNSYSASIDTITGDFTSNTANELGGAIYNYNSTIDTITGDFSSNTATYGGAIYNINSATIATIEGDFSGNTSRWSGGAISNSAHSSIDSIVGNFSSNTSNVGGAIFVEKSTISSIVGNITDNYATTGGGAIYAFDSTVTFEAYTGSDYSYTGNYAGDYDDKLGGFLYLEGGANTIFFDAVISSSISIGEVGKTGYDSIASNANYTSDYIYKTGVGDLIVNSSMQYYYGSLFVEEGYMEYNNDDALNLYSLSISKGATFAVDATVLSNYLKSNSITNKGTIALIGGTLSYSFDGSCTIASEVTTSVSLSGAITFDFTYDGNACLSASSSSVSISGISELYIYLDFLEDKNLFASSSLELTEGNYSTTIYYSEVELPSSITSLNATEFSIYNLSTSGVLTINSITSILATRINELYDEGEIDFNSLFSLNFADDDDSFTIAKYFTSDNGDYDGVKLRINIPNIYTSTDSDNVETLSYYWTEQYTLSSTVYNEASLAFIVTYDSDTPYLKGTLSSGEYTGYFLSNSATSGAAIYNSSTLSSIISEFIVNYATDGGAIYNEGDISAISSNFLSNSASGTGGAIYNIGYISSITSDFISNSASDYGGAIYNDYASEIDTISSDFINNYASDGGAIYSQGTINSILGYITGNYAENGAGIYNTATGSIVSVSSVFIGNVASSFGGAIYNSSGSISSITSDFSANTAIKGGAIYNNDGTIASIMGNFSGNYASTSGGAIYNAAGSITFSSDSGNDYYYLGNYAGSYNDAAGGFMYMENNAEAIFNTASDSSITIGDGSTGYDSIAGDGTITKTGEGTLSIYSSLEDFEGDIIISEGRFFTTDDNLEEASITIEKDGALLITSGSWVNYDNITINGTLEIGGEVSSDIAIFDTLLVNEDGVLSISASHLDSFAYTIEDKEWVEYLAITNNGVIALTEGTLSIGEISGTGYMLIAGDVEAKVSITSTIAFDLSDSDNYGTLTSYQTTNEDSENGTLTIGDVSIFLGSNISEDSYKILYRMDMAQDAILSVYYYDNAELSQYLSDGTVVYSIDDDGNFVLSDKVSIFTTTLSELYYDDACEINSAYYLSTATDSDIFSYTKYYLDDDGTYKSTQVALNVFDMDISDSGSGEKQTISYEWQIDSLGNISLAESSSDGDFSITYSTKNTISEIQYKDSSAADSSYINNFIAMSYETSSSIYGGIFSNYSNITEITGNFIGNYVNSTASTLRGGIFYNYATIGDITGSFVSNTAISATNTTYGGIIYSHSAGGVDASIGNITGDFVGNYTEGTSARGGVVFNYVDVDNSASVGNITGNFIGNIINATTADVQGGIIYNYSSQSATIGDITGDFIGNYAYAYSDVEGGLIFNFENYDASADNSSIYATIGNITGDFVGNYSYSATKFVYGGIIYNNNLAIIGDITGDFIANYAYSPTDCIHGGIIHNYNYATIGNITGDFISNYAYAYDALCGGIIHNDSLATIGDIEGDFSGNYAYSENSCVFGGIIYNDDSATMGDITGDFIANCAYSVTADVHGGIIHNHSAVIGDITGNFSDNYAYSETTNVYGGIIFNDLATIGNITGDFTGNYAYAPTADVLGGIIYNDDSATMGSITGDFTSNYAYSESSYVYGGIIYNDSATIGDITGDFTGNYAYSATYGVHGGIINNNSAVIGNITGDFGGNYAYSETDYVYGGIIFNASATIGNITGNFSDNYAYSESTYVYGGIIYNDDSATMGDITGNFSDNYAYSATYSVHGGIIYNDLATIGNITGDFTGNYAYANNSIYGGIIYNYDSATIGNIEGNFIGNYAIGATGAFGGAVYNRTSTMSFVASEGNDYYYTGNYASTDYTVDASDDANGGFLYMNSGTANFDTATDASITIGNGIAGYDSIAGTGTINKTGEGTLNIYSSTEYFTGTLNLKEGTLNLASTFGGDLEVTDGSVFYITLTSANVGSESILLGSVSLADELESFDFNISIGDYGASLGETVAVHNEIYADIINLVIDDLHSAYIEVLEHIIVIADEIKIDITDSQDNTGSATYTYTNDGAKLVNVALSDADYELSSGDTQSIDSISSDSANYLVLDGGTLNTSSMSVNNDAGVDSTKLVINSGTINISDTLSFESGNTSVGDLILMGGTVAFDSSSLISADDEATLTFNNTYITGDFKLSGFSNINMISTGIDSIISFTDETTLTVSGELSSGYEVGENVILAGSVNVSSSDDSIVAVKTYSGDITLADSTTVSAIITDEDGNFLSYGTALTNAEGTGGLSLYSDGSVSVYGDILTNSPLTVYTGDWSIKGSVDTTQNATDNDYIKIESAATLEVQGGIITTGGDDVTIDGTLILSSDASSLASFVDVGEITVGADGSLVIDADGLALGSTVEIADTATTSTASNASIIESAIDESGYSYIYEDGSIYFIAATYIDMLSSASSQNETTLGEALNGVAYTSNETSNIAIATLKSDIDANGLGAYMMNASSYIAEVNTMLLSNQNFANANRARAILAKNAGAYLETTELEVVEEATGVELVESEEIATIKYNNVAQLQSINFLGSKDASNGVAGYDYWSVGSTANFDSILSENALVGVSLGGTYNKAEGDAGDNANSTTFLLNAYGVYAYEGLEAFGNIGYAHFWNEGYKAGSGSADWDSDAFNALIAISYKLETVVEGLSINPLAMFNLVYLNSDSASYSNGVNLESQDYMSAKLMFGFEVECAITSQFNTIFRAMYAHECGDTSYDFSYGFTNVLNGIDYVGGTTGADSAVMGLGLSYDFSETCTAYFDYNAYIYDTLITHSLNFSLGIKF